MKALKTMVVILGLAVLVPSLGQGAELNVPADYATIQAAAAASTIGDTIVQTEPGDFSTGEHFMLYGVSLIGLGPDLCTITFTRDDTYIYGVEMTGPGEVTISGFHLNNRGVLFYLHEPTTGSFYAFHLLITPYFKPPDTPVDEPGISVHDDPDQVFLHNITVEGASYACIINRSSATVRDCMFINSRWGFSFSQRFMEPFEIIDNHDNLYWNNEHDYEDDATRGPGEFNADPLLDAAWIPDWSSPAINRASDGGTLGGIERDHAAFPIYFATDSGYKTDYTFTGGDEFALISQPTSADPYFQTLYTFVVLDVYGQYWFWNGGTGWTEDLAWHERTYDPHTIAEDVSILEFTWPENTGSASGIYFHSLTTDDNFQPWNPSIEMYSISFGYNS